ncbi:MAG TPA: FAD-dependent oxidoreductase [Microbacteriaceae bacterium]|nr:FAD-dependent oxidoreductase [Microbacteriaceae bacterium]
MSLPRVKLLERQEVARNTIVLRFEKPEGFEFRAGQYADYTLLEPTETDAEGDTREFTFSSAPFEDHLACTIRLRDTAFKRVVQKLPVGAEVELDAPYGSFVLHRKAARPAVFMTGGVGVTPARSILLQADHDHTGHKITLFYSNKTPADAAYLDEFTALSAANPDITFVPTMTAPGAAQSGWQGHLGRIDGALLAEHVPDLAAPIYYLCGPASMVRSMRSVLAEAGVDDDDIRVEEFLGY